MVRGMSTETYLGDGLYASFDGFMVTLRAPRRGGDHWVGLEPDVMRSLIQFWEHQTQVPKLDRETAE